MQLVAALYRIKKARRDEIIGEVAAAAKRWHNPALRYGITKLEQDRMAHAVRATEA